MNIVNVGYASTNYYVLADARPRLLVDAGWPDTLPQFQHTCQRMGIALAAIPYLLVTHYHPDHAGLVPELQRLGLQLLVPETQLHTPPAFRTAGQPAPRALPIVETAKRALRFQDSRTFLAGIGISGEILSTPGHSDDSVTLVLDEGAAFTGDLPAPWAAPDDPAHPVQKSWAAIRAHGATTIYAGHGPVWHLQ